MARQGSSKLMTRLQKVRLKKLKKTENTDMSNEIESKW